MKILSLTAGAAGMICGSCLRDNALAAELVARGHEVTLVPLYTPTTTDEANLSRDEVLFGGISVYLQQHLSWFRRTPRFLDRLWDSPRVIRAFATRSVSTDPKLLGDLTISMLEGERGVLRKEFDKLLEWIDTEPAPDIINLPNSLLIGLAGPLRKALMRPICCTLQGEDLFLDGLIEPYRDRVLALIRKRVQDVDRFIAVSDYYAPFMSRLLDVPSDRMAVVPLGINLTGYNRRRARGDTFRVGYFARIAPEKGLHLLADAYVQFRRRTVGMKARLEAAGYLPPAQVPYLDAVKRNLEKAGLAEEFTYRGALDRDGKLAFLRSLDVFSVPATYDEPKGVFLLEAMASGVPVVQPRRGAFSEIVEKTGGGLLVAPDDATALSDGLLRLFENQAMAEDLGERGFRGVSAHYSIARSADRLLEVYGELTSALSGNGEKQRGTFMPTGDVRSQIEAANRDWMAAFKRADAAGLAGLYTNQGQLLPANSDFVKGTAAIRAFWQAVFDMGLKNAVLETLEVEPHGDTAVEMGRYKLLLEGASVADAGKYIVVWKNNGGAWKLHRDIWTTSQPAKTS